MKVLYSFYHSTGLGDNIRGLITIKQIQKIMGFELYIDLNGHPIERYLMRVSQKMNYNHNVGFYAYDNAPHHDQMIHFFKDKDSIRIETNYYPTAVDEDTKQFMREFLKLKPEYAELFSKRVTAPYYLYHFRFGDKHICQENDTRFNVETDYYSCIDKYLRVRNPNSIIISDSLEFKHMCKYIANVYLNDPIHTRFNDNPKIQNDITETICDFYLIQNATKVYSYSAYPWISNFILWTSTIYDIPIERII
jgi:hypothetical protein